MTPLAIGVLMVLFTICFCLSAAFVFAMYATVQEAKAKGWPS